MRAEYLRRVKTYALHNDGFHNNYNGATLYRFPLCEVPKQSTSDEQNLRDGDVINVSTVDMEWHFSSSSSGPLFVRWALLVPKDCGASVTLPEADFFRGYGTSRAVDFSTLLSAWDRHERLLNDDIFEVVGMGKFNLHGLYEGGLSGPELGSNVSAQKEFRKSIPIYRQFKFDDDGTIQGTQPWFCYWMDSWNRQAGSPALLSVCAIARMTRVNFIDIK